jgi:TonB family protein
VLSVSFILALAIEIASFTALSRHVFSQRPILQVSEMNPIEAEIFKKPEIHEHLTEVKPVVKMRAPEPVLSKRVDVGRALRKDQPSNLDQSNQTDSAPPLPASHGPLVVSSASPKLPSYLRDQNLKTSVLIEFVVGSDGLADPHLIGSSGNEELDQLALKSAHDWKFKSAIQDGKPVTSRVRLRINFEVQ